MPLERQIIDIPINGGVDTKTDPRLIKPPFLSRLYNGVFDKTGRIAKRHGQTSLGTTGSSGHGDPHTLFAHNSKVLCQITDNDTDSGVHHFSALNGGGRYGRPGTLGSSSLNPQEFRPCEVKEAPWYAGDASVVSVDNAIYGNYLLNAWYVTGDGVYAAIIEADTGAHIFGPTRLQALAATSHVRCATIGTNLFVFWGDTANARIYHAYAETASAIIGFSAPAFNAAANFSLFEVAEDTTNASAHLLWSNTAGAVTMWRYGSTGTIATTYAGAGVDGRGCVDVYYHEAQDKVCIYTAPTAAVGAVRVLNATSYVVDYGPHTVFSSLVGTGQVRATMSRYDSGGGSSTDLFVCITELDSGDSRYHTRYNVLSDIVSGSTLINTSSTQSHGRLLIYGRAFVPYAGSFPMVPLVYNRAPFLTQVNFAAYVCHPRNPSDTSQTFTVVSRLGHDRAVEGTFSRVLQTDATKNTWRMLGKVQRLTDVFGADAYSFTLPGEATRAVFVNGNTYLASGNPTCFDGVHTYEMTPHLQPEQPTVTFAGSGGSMTAGAHQYMVVYEFEDENGVLHRSAPSAASATATNVANDTATVSFTRLSLAARDSVNLRAMKVSLYRNVVGGTVFYRVKTIAPTVSGSDATTWTATDTAADATILTNEAIYTTGGVLSSEPPPPLLDMLLAKNRLIAISAQNRREVWYTKSIEPTVAPEFNASLVIRLPQEGTALATLDDKIIVFSESDIYAISGDGPLDTGEQDTFTPPQLVASDAGCISRNSVVSGPFGVMFQSAKGLYVLDRSLSVQYIGAPVEDLISTYTINSAVLVEKANEVRFTLDIPSPPEGTYVSSLVYNYLYGAWSGFTNTLSTHATLWDGLYVRATTTTAAHKENSAGYSDSGSVHIPLTVRTGWINVGSVQGFQRVRKLLVLGSKVAAHTLTVKIGYDYRDAFDTTISFAEAEIDTLAASVYQYAVHIPRQKCQAIRFEISDGAPAGGADAGFTIARLSLELGTKRGTMKLPSSAKK